MLTRRKVLSGAISAMTALGMWGFAQAEKMQSVDAFARRTKTPTRRPTRENKKTKTPTATATTGDIPMSASSRNVATIPNFTPAAGSFIIPNTPTVATTFVLQGDTDGMGTWVTISYDEYEIMPFSGLIVQRVTLRSDGDTFVDWSTAYQAYRIHTYAKLVSGTLTTYSDQSVTFAETDEAYNPVGQVGDINGEMLINAVTNVLVAGGGAVVADENGITLTSGTGDQNKLKFNTGVFRDADLWSNVFAVMLEANPEGTSNTSTATLAAHDGSGDVYLDVYASSATTAEIMAYATGGASLKGMVLGDNSLQISDGATTGFDLNGKILRIRVSKTPSSASDTGFAGEMCWDSSYIYVCVATNTWKRVAIATW